MNNDAMIYFGGEVKALNDSGLVGGYLVRFTDAKRKDLSGEFFTSKTYLGPMEGDGAESLFDHGFPIPIPDGVDSITKSILMEVADHTFAPIKTRRDAMGIWAEVVLNLADEYEKHVYQKAKQNKLGWSSGAPGHRVKKLANGEITSWPIAEGSLTPTPAEPMNRAISMKSFGQVKFVPIDDPDEEDEPNTESKLPAAKSLAARLTRFIDDSVDEGKSRNDMVKLLARECLLSSENVESLLSGQFRPNPAHLKAISRTLGLSLESLQASIERQPKTIKGIFEDALAEETQEGPCGYMLWGILADVTGDIATMAGAAQTTGTEFDMSAKIAEAVDEYSTRLKASIVGQINDWVSGDDEMESYDPDEFHLKSLTKVEPDAWQLVTKSLPMDEHLQLVVTAEEDLVARFTANADKPRGKSYKAGRELSNTNRQRLMKLQQMHKDAHDTVAGKIQELLDATQPKASEVQKRAAQLNHLRVKETIRQLGGLNG